MKGRRLVYFHGSPGTPKEFEQFEQYMSKNTEVIKNNRYTPESDTKRFSELEKDVVFIGYSWGAVEALLAAKENLAQTRAVVLVSPYVLQRSPSPIKNALISVPVVGGLLISLLGRKMIREFIVKTCAPEPVPATYSDVANEISDPRKLKVALKEKMRDNNSLVEALRIIKESKLPVGILRGGKDIVDVDGQQIKFLRRYLDFTFEQELSGAGHAIVWNHPGELVDFVNTILSQLEKQDN